MIKNQFDCCMKIFQINNVTEILNTNISTFVDNHGILHNLVCSHTSQQMRIAERRNKQIVEAFNHIVYI